MVDTQLGARDVYVDHSGYQEGHIEVSRDPKDNNAVWLKFGRYLVVCLTPDALGVLLAKIKEVTKHE